MEQQVEEFYASLEAAGVAVRFTHCQGGNIQWEYDQWLLEQCGGQGAAPVDLKWREDLYTATGKSRKLNGISGYRDALLPGAEAAEAAARQEAAHVRAAAAAMAAAAPAAFA